MKICRIFTPVLLSCYVSLFFLANPSHAGENPPDKSPIEITSDSMISEERNSMITFKGSVIAKKDNIVIYSDTMIVQYGENRELKDIIASGNVKLLRENKEIRSEKARYFPADEKIVFTGNPVFRENNNTVSGSTITYFIPLEKSVVEDSRVILK